MFIGIDVPETLIPGETFNTDGDFCDGCGGDDEIVAYLRVAHGHLATVLRLCADCVRRLNEEAGAIDLEF